MWHLILEILLVGLLIGAAVWIIARFIVPLWRLEKMVQRIEAGENVPAWEVDGAPPLQRVAKSIERIGQQLHQLRNEKAAVSGQLESIFDQLNSGIAMVDRAGVILKANHAFRQIFKLTEDPENKRLLDLVQIFEINDVLAQSRASGRAAHADVTFKVIEGDFLATRSVHFSAVPTAAGDRRESRNRLLIAVDQSRLREMESHERQMIGSVSHELRTPLSVFKGYLEALREAEADGKPETRRILDVLTRHSQRLNHLVEDLLTLSRLEEGEMELQLEPVRVPRFFERLERDCQQFLKEPFELISAVEEGIDVVFMDEFRIEQVFYNLIDNAQRHSDANYPIVMGVKKHPEIGEYHFYVKDRGRGIPSDQLHQVFTRFYRVDRARSRQRGGTGLGLTIVQEIVRAHGGRAWIESNLGEGTTVWFSLPPTLSDKKPPHQQKVAFVP